MAYQYNNKNSNNTKVNPEEILDILLKNTANFKCDLVKKIVEGTAMDLDEVKKGFGMLVDDVEMAAIGCNYISKIKKKFVEQELDEHETRLLEALRIYFREGIKKGTGNHQYANAENRARSLIREVIEGPYYAKLNEKILELYEKPSPDYKFSKSDLAQKKYLLDSFRFQLILEAVTSQKAVKETWNA